MYTHCLNNLHNIVLIKFPFRQHCLTLTVTDREGVSNLAGNPMAVVVSRSQAIHYDYV